MQYISRHTQVLVVPRIAPFLSITLTSQQIDNTIQLLTFDSDSTTCILDNSANTHIWNRRQDFVPGSLKKLNDGPGVATVGSSTSSPRSIGDVSDSWIDNSGLRHQHILTNVLFFPDSPVSIFSVTCFSKQLHDEEGTWIKTKQHTSRFTWENNQFGLDVIHPSCDIPTLSVNINYASFQSYCSFVSTISPQSTTTIIASPSLSTTTTATLDLLDRSVFVTQNIDDDPTNNDDLPYPIFEVGQELHLMQDG